MERDCDCPYCSERRKVMDRLEMIKTIRNAVSVFDNPARWDITIAFGDGEAGKVIARLCNNLEEVARTLLEERRIDRRNRQGNRRLTAVENESPCSPNTSPRSPT